MSQFVSTYKPSVKANKFIKEINKSLKKTLEGFIEIGRTLQKAEKELGRKEWIDMVSTSLPFSRRTAEKLVKIASDTRITDPNNLKHLPPHWTSLHEITLLSDEQFKEGIREGIIAPDVDRKSITNLKKGILSNGKETKRVNANSNQNDKDTHSVAKIIPSNDNSDTNQLVIARFLADETIGLEAAIKIHDDLKLLSQKHGLSLQTSGYIQKMILLNEIEEYHNQKTEEYSEQSNSNNIQLINDAFFQLETGKKIDLEKDGSYQKNDLRHQDNPFRNFDKEQLYGYCIDLQILTKYTPVEMLDARANIENLAKIFLTGKEKQQKYARAELEKLSKQNDYAAELLDIIDA